MRRTAAVSTANRHPFLGQQSDPHVVSPPSHPPLASAQPYHSRLSPGGLADGSAGSHTAEATLRRARTALRTITRAGDPVTFTAVAAHPGVSPATCPSTPNSAPRSGVLATAEHPPLAAVADDTAQPTPIVAALQLQLRTARARRTAESAASDTAPEEGPGRVPQRVEQSQQLPLLLGGERGQGVFAGPPLRGGDPVAGDSPGRGQGEQGGGRVAGLGLPGEQAGGLRGVDQGGQRGGRDGEVAGEVTHPGRAGLDEALQQPGQMTGHLRAGRLGVGDPAATDVGDPAQQVSRADQRGDHLPGGRAGGKVVVSTCRCGHSHEA